MGKCDGDGSRRGRYPRKGGSYARAPDHHSRKGLHIARNKPFQSIYCVFFSLSQKYVGRGHERFLNRGTAAKKVLKTRGRVSNTFQTRGRGVPTLFQNRVGRGYRNRVGSLPDENPPSLRGGGVASVSPASRLHTLRSALSACAVRSAATPSALIGNRARSRFFVQHESLNTFLRPRPPRALSPTKRCATARITRRPGTCTRGGRLLPPPLGHPHPPALAGLQGVPL